MRERQSLVTSLPIALLDRFYFGVIQRRRRVGEEERRRECERKTTHRGRILKNELHRAKATNTSHPLFAYVFVRNHVDRITSLCTSVRSF